jgi:hypothetical protein
VPGLFWFRARVILLPDGPMLPIQRLPVRGEAPHSRTLNRLFSSLLRLPSCAMIEQPAHVPWLVGASRGYRGRTLFSYDLPTLSRPLDSPESYPRFWAGASVRFMDYDVKKSPEDRPLGLDSRRGDVVYVFVSVLGSAPSPRSKPYTTSSALPRAVRSFVFVFGRLSGNFVFVFASASTSGLRGLRAWVPKRIITRLGALSVVRESASIGVHRRFHCSSFAWLSPPHSCARTFRLRLKKTAHSCRIEGRVSCGLLRMTKS